MYNGTEIQASGGLDQARFYADQNALKSLARSGEANAENLRAAAQEFESLFINMMFRSMREANSVFAEGNPFESQESTLFREMLDNQLSVEMAQGGGIGLADILIRQLAPTEPKNTSDKPAYGASGELDAQSNTGTNTSTSTNTSANTHTDSQTRVAATGLTAADRAVAELYGDASTFQANAEVGVGVDKGVGLGVSGGRASGTNTRNDDKTAALHPQKQAQMLFGDIHSANAAPQTLERLKRETASDIAPTQEAAPEFFGRHSVTEIDKPLYAQDAPKTFNSPEQFVAAVWPHAQRASEKLGVDPRVLVAQAALETGWGKHIMGNGAGGSSHNLFGIKAQALRPGSVAHMTTEYVDGQPQRLRENFRTYNNFSESFDDYVKLVMNSERYAPARAQAQNPKAFMQALQGAGYATDPNYAQKIYQIYQGLTGKLAALAPALGDTLAMVVKD